MIKQSITPEQAKEINGKIMTIGEMIEYLGDEWLDKVYFVNPLLENIPKNKKLCDLLWEVVKKDN